MRVLAGFLGLVIAGFISLALMQRDAAPTPRAGFDALIEELQCHVLGLCPELIEGAMRAALFDHFRNITASGFATPPWAEPEPTPERRRRAEAILECTFEDFEAVSQVAFLTEPGRAWAEGEPAPRALVALAEGGDAQAQWELGYGLATLRSGAFDETQERAAFDWIRSAAQNGHPSAQAEVGAAYSMGYFHQDINWTLARTHLRAAVAQGDPIASLSLAIAPPEDGRDLEDYASERLDLELASANACYRDAAILVANRLHSPGRGFEYDPELGMAIVVRASGFDPETRSVRPMRFPPG